MAFAFVYPGQGSQSVGMMAAYGDSPIVRATFDEASATLGQDLWQLVADGPAELLAQTVNTQPLMLTSAIAAYRLWLDKGGRTPAVVAGHSLGEYSALVASGVLTLAQAAPLVRLRAAAMQEAVPVGAGAMAAILGMDAAKVIAGCAEATAGFGAGSPEVVEAVNFNDPAQTVIAGSKAGVDKACELLKAAGAKRALTLPVSAPFHSSLMKPAAEKLRAALAALPLQAPQIPVLNNVDVAVQQDPDAIRDALYRQAFGPVRWVECVQALKARGVTHVIECGPGKVLAGMTKRIDPELVGAPLYDPATLAEIKELLA
mgnify:CR=1 FL=1